MDRAWKSERIEAIDDEVKVLHPLLHQIFKCIDNVSYVEHTHGPDEMGADFVLERLDDAINETYHVGVVAKTDKILQNFSDIERQIDECRVKRTIRQGKQEIRLQEIWVVTSKSFSRNARIKIAEKYPTQKIHFFDSDWLLDQVDKHAPYYWQQLPNATGTYISALARNLESLDAQTSLLQLVGNRTSKYIELDIVSLDTDGYKKTNRATERVARLVNLHEEVSLNKLSVVEAEMGFGKSKLARHVALHFANPEVYKKKKILPVFQQFVVFSKQNFKNLDDRIAALVGETCYAEIREADGKFLLILDGIDEINGDMNACSTIIADLLTEIRKVDHVHVLLTTRPFKLLHDMPDFGRTAKWYRIRPLSTKKLIQFIKEVCQEIDLPKHLYNDLAKSELFKQLPQNPIAASLLSNLIAQRKNELPSNLTELYSKSIEYMLGRWDERRDLSTEQLFAACQRFSRKLARYMIENKLIYVSVTETRQMFEDYVSQRNISVPVDAVYDYLMNRSNIFGMLDEGTIFFRHRSFAEYLYAVDAYERRDLGVDERAFHPYWTNIYFFYIGLIQECQEILEQLVAQRPTDETARWVRFLQLTRYLLAGYQTPYAVTEASLHVVLCEVAQFYLDIKDGKTSSKLNELSEMRLLWLFATLAKHAFGYNFFHKALPLALAQIDENQSFSNDVKFHALFFGACALADLDDACGYEHLLHKRKTEDLPLAISIGVECEMRFGGAKFQKNALLKQHEKRLHKLLSAGKEETRSTQNKLERLFDTPLKSLTNAGQGTAHKKGKSGPAIPGKALEKP